MTTITHTTGSISEIVFLEHEFEIQTDRSFKSHISISQQAASNRSRLLEKILLF